MTLDEFIERRAAAALAEIKAMADNARREINAGFMFINRSNAQRRRWARERQLQGKS